jgi:hypothetical protein
LLNLKEFRPKPPVFKSTRLNLSHLFRTIISTSHLEQLQVHLGTKLLASLPC